MEQARTLSEIKGAFKGVSVDHTAKKHSQAYTASTLMFAIATLEGFHWDAELAAIAYKLKYRHEDFTYSNWSNDELNRLPKLAQDHTQRGGDQDKDLVDALKTILDGEYKLNEQEAHALEVFLANQIPPPRSDISDEEQGAALMAFLESCSCFEDERLCKETIDVLSMDVEL